MISQAKFAHTNLIARDWQALAQFYEAVFGCVRLQPERDYSGPLLDAGTGVPEARLRGVHLLLPGHGDAGPTLEIFHYSELAPDVKALVNRPGFAHVAFMVPDVPKASAEVLAHGGSAIGEIVTMETATRKDVTWCYVSDPEGNIIELQSWSPGPGE
jgi:predicted enzyme related to lactoylglutathione lyase